MVALLLALPAAGCMGRALIQGRAELSAAVALRDGYREGAIAHARRAASWYLPFAPHVEGAYRELADLAMASEREGDRETALYAWRSIRAASKSTRWLIEPHLRERRRADAAIARLSSEERPSSVSERPVSARDLERLHAGLLAKEEGPHPAWVLVLLLGLIGWGGGGGVLLSRGMTADGQLVREVAAKAGVAVVVGMLAFVWGLWMV